MGDSPGDLADHASAMPYADAHLARSFVGILGHCAYPSWGLTWLKNPPGGPLHLIGTDVSADRFEIFEHKL